MSSITQANGGSQEQFIVYRRVDKAPVSYRTGLPASAHDPANWTDVATAQATVASWGAEYGLGFVLTEQAHIAVIDVDSCRDPETGAVSLIAQTLISMLPGAYVEISISGRGIHIWFSYSGEMPPHGSRAAGIGEFYHRDRYICIGAPYEAPGFTQGSLAVDHAAALPGLIATFFPPDKTSVEDTGWREGHELGWELPDDDELIRRALNFNGAGAAFGNKASFADLWNRNVPKLAESYPDAGGRPYDESAADMALASKLAWLTGNDCERIERLMWKSALVRDKWETHKTYLCERTITRSLVKDGEFYKPNYRAEAPGVPGPPGAAYVPAATVADMAAIAAANPNKDEAISIMMQLGTQDSIAAAFTTLYADNLKFDHSRKKWHIWDGTRWREDNKKRVFDLAVSFCRQKNPEGKSSIGSASFARGVEEIAASRPSVAVSGSEWDRDNYLLNTPAGTIDLRTGKMRPHDPADLITKCAAAAPGTVSDGATFRKFMLEITEGDEELVRFHQISLGACLSGAIEDHWLLFWVGEGRNGKNTLGDLVEEAMGDYARTIRTSTLMSKSHQSHPEELANLQGIRMAISSEVNDGDHWDESRIKQVTGDATISARFMYGSSFTYLRTHKHIVYGNSRPQLRSTDAAIRSRIKIAPFKVSFRGREDKDLPRRMREEMGYVLQWLIEGHQQWMAAGKRLPKCAAVDAESADYFAAQSTPEMWLEECTEVVDPLSQATGQCPRSGDLYRSYAEWKKNRGEPALSQTRWAETMQKRFQKVKSMSGFHYKGLRILPLQYGAAPFPLVPPPPGVNLAN